MFALFQKEEYPEDFKISKSLEILGINIDAEIETKRYLLNEISCYLFDVKDSGIEATQKKIFDYNLDFNYYYVDFKRYNVDLLKDNVSWFKLNLMLGEFILMEGTRINEVIGYRNYETPPKYNDADEFSRAEDSRKQKLKRIYSLPCTLNESVENGLDKLWKYLEKKAGDNK